jgi:predicted RNA-binding Zn-ribbon protein involved in translation (DUF1610 family)
MTDEQTAMRVAKKLLDEKRYRCNNCDFASDQLDNIKDIFDRVDPGELMPAGECPECGALVHSDQDFIDAGNLFWASNLLRRQGYTVLDPKP